MTGGRPFITTSADLAVLCTQACRSSAEAVDVAAAGDFQR
jgi:hypothetical protein